MEQYLIEYDTLAKLVDALISKKYPDQPPANIEEIRKNEIQKLDNKIGVKIFGSLNEQQLEEVNVLLDNPNQDSVDFKKFFEDAGIDLNQKIEEAMKEYSNNFLGGKNE